MATRPAVESRAPGRSIVARSGSREFGTRKKPAASAATTTGTTTRKTAFQSKCSTMKPESSMPMAPPPPATPAQIATAFARSSRGKTLVRIESVAGMIMAPAAPMTTRAPMSSPDESAIRPAYSEAKPNRARPSLHDALAAESLAERAHREEQAGEHERVGVHHPLLLGRRCAQVARERRQHDVQRRVAQHDDEQAGAEDCENPPTPVAGWRRSIAGEHGSDSSPRSLSRCGSSEMLRDSTATCQ